MKNNRISTITRNKLLRKGLLAIFFLVCVALLSLSGSRVSSQTSTPTTPPQAQNEIKPVAHLIRDAKSAGSDFTTVEPFNRQTRSAAADVARRRAVTAGSILQLRPNALADLVNRNAQSLTLHLPTFAGPPVELELVQVDIFAQGFKVVTSDSNDQPVPYERGVHYWGVIKGIENSLATVSIFKDEVIGFYSSPQEGNFVLGKLAGNNPARDHILYAEKDLTSAMPVSCDQPTDNAVYSPAELDAPPAAVTRCVKIYIEADFDLFLNKGSVTATANYITGFFNQSAALYNNEGIPITISQIFVWNLPSPYTGGNSFTQLAQFQATRTSFNGDIAHLVDIQNQGGLAASFNGFCNPDRSQSQCYSGIFPTYSDVPTYSWTVEVFTHEMGHLFGSRHTHACVWNGNGTAIDGCGQSAGFQEGFCLFGPIPGDGGTIMSYCHLLSVGINFSKGFGPQPGNVIRNRFNNASCLGTCGQPDSPTIRFDQSNLTVNEGVGAISITVTRSGPTSPAVNVDYATSDGTANQKGDYTLALGRLSFAAGETSKTFPIFITDDGFVEGNENFTVTLSNPTGGAALGVPSQTTITIVSNDSVPSQPIDDSAFFIRQQYIDFLNREPDSDGLQFYLNILNGCGSDIECIRYTRGALSANFFRSPEFGQRGGYVANLFNIVFGQRPKIVAELTDATKVERPHYLEFMADLGRLSAPTDAETNFKKDQLAVAWLGRTEVQAILPNSFSNQQFVQKLESTAGVILANESTLIANLNNGSQTRAQVLRAVAESSEVTTKFKLQNFVTMQYIGHLRREPEDCHGSPDPANCGYIFHYNRFGPDIDPDQIENLITRGFIESPEYRGRFGPN